MSHTERLIDLLSWLHDEVVCWAAGLSETEREAAGRADAWAARDLLVHFAEWSGVLCQQLAAAAEGSEQPELPTDDEINQVFFERNRGLSWAEVIDKTNATHTALIAQMREMPTGSLDEPFQPGERPIRQSVVFSTVDHTLRHMSENLVIRGQPAAADAMMVEGLRRTAAVDDTPNFQAIITYNLACHHALNGRPEDALALLVEALAGAPDMAENAAQDVDFASLRDNPRFQALVKKSD